MRVLAVIHSLDAGPELFAEVLAEDGHELVVWDIRTQGSPPRDVDAVMVFGGDQNVGEEVEHPWLHEEYDALRAGSTAARRCSASASARRRLAHAFGATVAAVPEALGGFDETHADRGRRGGPGGRGAAAAASRRSTRTAYAFEAPPGATALAEGRCCRRSGSARSLGAAVPSGDPP